jgi:putative YphP/YqiW family bacilliredoxin
MDACPVHALCRIRVTGRQGLFLYTTKRTMAARASGRGDWHQRTELFDMYPAELVAPMKTDLTSAGFEQLQTPDQVDQALTQPGTVLCVVNSVCGCAAGAARPGVKMSLNGAQRPDKLVTVFAGVDTEATMQARRHFLPYPPSSPCMALFKDGKLVHFLERHHIEGRSAQMIAENLMMAYEEFC